MPIDHQFLAFANDEPNGRQRIQCLKCDTVEKNDGDSKVDLKIVCSICNQRVRGFVMLCKYCNHGGHYEHLKEWFEANNRNPY